MANMGAAAEPKVGIIVVAYNAERTIGAVLDRIPIDFWPSVTAVWVSDDQSSDGTHGAALEWHGRNDHRPVSIVRQPLNLGYGGNQKVGYRWAIEQELDIVVLLHGDGQYAPELLPAIIRPVAEGRAEAVLGSRMGVPGGARRGGMPPYKRIGNRILTTMQNRIAGTDLSEWHSGYRAYSVAALRSINVGANSDGFDFDTEVLLQLLSAGHRVDEIPIPTYYGDEISYVNGMGYAAAVTADMVAWRLGALGFGSGHLAPADTDYPIHDEGGSHALIIERLASMPPSRVLDIGCGSGALAEQLRLFGHRVVGVDRVCDPRTVSRVDTFVQADLEVGLPDGLGHFDVVIVADVLEHTSRPDSLLAQIVDTLAPDGCMLLSVPNFGHWYPRIRVLTGTWDYDQRGILDRTHLRFFSRRTLRRLVRTGGLKVRVEHPVGMPLASIDRRLRSRAISRIERFAIRAWPTMFAYQFVLEAIRPPRTPHLPSSPAPQHPLGDDGPADGSDRSGTDSATEY